jgi:cation-transporting P-type ATPase 13A2
MAKFYFLYQATTLKKATHMGILGQDGKFHLVEAFEIDLPKINNSPLLTYFKTNVHSQKTKMFEYKLTKYIYSPIKKNFLCLKFQINCSFDILSRKFLSGLTEAEVEYQRNIFGDCDQQVRIDSVFTLLLQEIKDPFYIFQFFSVMLWMFNAYVKYAIVIIITTVISLIIAIYEVRTNLLGIQKIARYSCNVIIYRNCLSTNQKKGILCSSSELVPGDLFELPEDDLNMPCDAVLISGNVIMNESMLTGESIPVLKSAIPNSVALFNYKEDSKHILYSGTKIIQKRNLKDSKVLAIAINTGFNTEKGKLIRSILFPKELVFKFQTDSWRYILFMAFMSIFGFLISIRYMRDNNMTWFEIINKGLDLITTTVPPALPACLGIGISYALSRLKKSGIKCINRQRVNVAGQVNLICFDKTGTLTEDHLQLYGFRPINFDRSQNKFVFDFFLNDLDSFVNEGYNFQKNYLAHKDELPNSDTIFQRKDDKIKMLRVLFTECLATCHSITRVNGKLIGDPIDLEMFDSTKWILKENLEDKENYDPLVLTYLRYHLEKDTKDLIEEFQRNNPNSNENDLLEFEERLIKSSYEIGIVRRFEFSSKLQRMSVIAKNVNEEHFKIFCKGSPEKIKDLCRVDTIPENFNTILSVYTNKGFRVLALAVKQIKMDYMQCQKMSRESAENNLMFLGFMIVQNKLKRFTTPSIEILQSAGLKLVMATGDNILTAVSVSRDCKLIPTDACVYQCDISPPDGSNEYNLKCNLIYGQECIPEEEENEINTSIYSDDNIGYNKKFMSGEMSIALNINNFQTTTPLRKHAFSENFNIETLEHESDEDEELENEEYDDEYNIRSNVNTQKKEKKPVAYEIDSLRIDLGNLNHSESEKLELEFDNISSDGKVNNNYVIAITGTTFEILYKLKNKYLYSQDLKFKPYFDLFRFILSKTKIYARMSPDQKTLLIESLKSEKFTVAMCGDGANDIGALRAADVGVSLSIAEASIAAHFTSTVSEITCLIKLFREGKASLITSIQCFKFMMLYSMIQFFSATICLICGSYLSEYEFLVVDLLLIFPLAILIARTGAYKELTPHQPTGALISVPIITSVLFQSLIQFLAQVKMKIFKNYF